MNCLPAQPAVAQVRRCSPCSLGQCGRGFTPPLSFAGYSPSCPRPISGPPSLSSEPVSAGEAPALSVLRPLWHSVNHRGPRGVCPEPAALGIPQPATASACPPCVQPVNPWAFPAPAALWRCLKLQRSPPKPPVRRAAPAPPVCMRRDKCWGSGSTLSGRNIHERHASFRILQ